MKPKIAMKRKSEKRRIVLILAAIEILLILALLGLLDYDEKTPSKDLDSSLSSLNFAAQQSGGGSGAGATACTPSRTCDYYYNLNQCGNELNDGCQYILTCNSCINGKICSNGNCIVPPSCTSDTGCTSLTGVCGIGKCNLTNGVCFAEYNQTTDICRSSLSECDAVEHCSGALIDCPSDVNNDGASCSGGFCRGEECTASCADSEGGNYYSKGNIIYFYNNPSNNFYGWHESEDSCTGSDNMLNEFSCEVYNPQEMLPSQNYYCPNGCFNGSCAQAVYLVADDNSPRADFVFLSSLSSWIDEEYGNSNPSIVKTIKNNSQVTRSMLDNKTTIFVYNKQVNFIVGKNSPSKDYILAVDSQAYTYQAK
jgi:hypothetical protein